MEKKLTIEYDEQADSLCILFCPTYPAQETVELDYGVIGRTHPDTGAIEYLEILFGRGE